MKTLEKLLLVREMIAQLVVCCLLDYPYFKTNYKIDCDRFK